MKIRRQSLFAGGPEEEGVVWFSLFWSDVEARRCLQRKNDGLSRFVSVILLLSNSYIGYFVMNIRQGRFSSCWLLCFKAFMLHFQTKAPNRLFTALFHDFKARRLLENILSRLPFKLQNHSSLFIFE